MSFLFILSFAMVFGVTDDGLKPVPVQEGKNAHFMVNTTMPITHLRIGGNESFSASPLYMRVGQDNTITEINGTIYSGRLAFDGNLQMGHAWVTLKNVGPSDYGKVFRLYYAEDGKAPTKEDFVITPEAESYPNNDTRVNSTVKIENGTSPNNGTDEPSNSSSAESYPNNDTRVNSTVKTENGTSPNNSTDEPSNSSSDDSTAIVNLLIAFIAFFFTVLAIAYFCYTKRRKSRAEAPTTANIENPQPLQVMPECVQQRNPRAEAHTIANIENPQPLQVRPECANANGTVSEDP